MGAIDWNLRDFHGYKTPNGTTYNAYLIVDEKIALIDTVKRPFKDELLGRVREIVDLDKIDYLVVNHVEMDHSGSFPLVAKELANAKILATENGKEELLKHHGPGFDIETVEDGQTLSLGSKTLSFLATPMLHWPDSMMTYVQEDKVLFSSDGFGQHYASSQRFDDELDVEMLYRAAGDYYSNILWLYSPLLSRLIKKVTDAGIELDIIAPDHGVMWRDNPLRTIQWYSDWSEGKSEDSVVIVYETMWESTEKMAKAMAEGIMDAGVEVKLMRMRDTERSYVLRELLFSKGILVGSPTLNNGMFPTIGGLLTYLKGLRPKNRIGAVFGSYGWGGGACAAMKDELESAGVEIALDAMELKWVPTGKELEECREYGKAFADKIKG